LNHEEPTGPAFDRIGRFYDDLVDRYGHDPRACHYGRSESQRVKFRVLSEVTDLTGCRILDVGCGFADYADYLTERAARTMYTGTDISARMIEEARRRRPELDLRHVNILDELPRTSFDIVTANGIFYLLGDNAPSLMRRLVETMFRLAETAVAFNSLSSWAETHESGEFHADPLETMDFCRSLTPWVVCRHEYHPRDFTIYMYRRRPLT
jgi:SAM-dependent methyltransferase